MRKKEVFYDSNPFYLSDQKREHLKLDKTPDKVDIKFISPGSVSKAGSLNELDGIVLIKTLMTVISFWLRVSYNLEYLTSTPHFYYSQLPLKKKS